MVERELLGDATEQGILKCYESILGNSEEVRQQNPKKIGTPFNLRNKNQASVHFMEEGTHSLEGKIPVQVKKSALLPILVSQVTGNAGYNKESFLLGPGDR